MYIVGNKTCTYLIILDICSLDCFVYRLANEMREAYLSLLVDVDCHDDKFDIWAIFHELVQDLICFSSMPECLIDKIMDHELFIIDNIYFITSMIFHVVLLYYTIYSAVYGVSKMFYCIISGIHSSEVMGNRVCGVFYHDTSKVKTEEYIISYSDY